MRKLYLSNQLLRDHRGHHLGYNLALADAASRAGLQPCLVTHRTFAEVTPAGVKVLRQFRTDFRADPPAWVARNSRALRWLEYWCDHRFAADLRSFASPREEDAVFAQMLAPRHFLRWLSWFGRRIGNSRKPPVLVIHLGYRPERFVAPKITGALKAIPAAFRDRLVFVTDSEKLCTAFEEILGAKVHYLPHILSYNIPVNTRPVSGSQRLNVFALGNARREKGFQEVVEAVRVISSAGRADDFRFVVQSHDADHSCKGYLETLPPHIEGLEWLPRALENMEYLGCLAEADILLLPYHLDCYAMRTSGVFCEARVAGIPVVTTQGSWAGDRVEREGGGWLVHERDSSALAATLLEAKSTFSQTKQRSLELVGQSKKEFDRDRFMQELLALIPQLAHK